MKKKRTDPISYVTIFILHFAGDNWIANWSGSYQDDASASSPPTCGLMLKFTAPSCPSVHFFNW